MATAVKPNGLQLTKLASFQGFELVEQLLPLDEGHTVAVMPSWNRTLEILDVAGGRRTHQLELRELRQHRSRPEDEQVGALFAHGSGFGAVFDDYVAMFDTPDVAAPRILPITNRVDGPIQAGVPLPCRPLRAVHDLRRDLVVVVFDERQARNRKTFLGGLRLGDSSATWVVAPARLELPGSEAERWSQDWEKHNNAVLVDVGVVNDELVVASYGKRIDLGIYGGARLHLFPLNDALQPAADCGELPVLHCSTQSTFSSDGRWLGEGEARGKSVCEIVFYSLTGAPPARANLRSKRVDVAPLQFTVTPVHARHGDYLWLADGQFAGAINAYAIRAG